MASSQNDTQQSRTPTPVRRGQKNTKTDHRRKGKEPKRGFGVEKLERIRMQEILQNPGLNMNLGLLAPGPNMYNGFQSPRFGGYPFGVGSSSNALIDISNENNMGYRYHDQSEFWPPCKRMRYDFGFLGSSVGGFNQNTALMFNQENPRLGFNQQFVPYAQPAQPAAELLAVHKASSEEGEKLVMEYDFFPEWKNSARNHEIEMNHDQENSSLVAAEASTVADEAITTDLEIGVPGHDSVDLSLSLKLPY